MGLRARRMIYGWFDLKNREFRLSEYPADAPIRPSFAVSSRHQATEIALKKRAQICWWPALPNEYLIDGE